MRRLSAAVLALALTVLTACAAEPATPVPAPPDTPEPAATATAVPTPAPTSTPTSVPEPTPTPVLSPTPTPYRLPTLQVPDSFLTPVISTPRPPLDIPTPQPFRRYYSAPFGYSVQHPASSWYVDDQAPGVAMIYAIGRTTRLTIGSTPLQKRGGRQGTWTSTPSR